MTIQVWPTYKTLPAGVAGGLIAAGGAGAVVLGAAGGQSAIR
jgi:hypothetical protein